MIEIGKTLVSAELLQKKFVCDLNACKGICCIEGDAGAPLEKEETTILEKEYQKVKPFMRKEGIEAVEEQGTFVVDKHDGEFVTPLVKGKECAYVNFDEKGIAKCAIEEAFNAGKTDFLKPISCHLYPVRISSHRTFDAVNYDRWKICESACACGAKLNVKVYQFVKSALIRKYGKEWFEELTKADKFINKDKASRTTGSQ